MMFYTHLVFGFLVGLLSINWLHPGNQILFLLFVLFGALLPDIDHPKSKIGKHVKVVSYLFEHRGFFHSIFAVILFAFITEFLFSRMITYALLIGYSSHLVSDAITKEGIMPLHPVSKGRIRGFLTTGKTGEHLLLILLTAVSVWYLFRL